MNTTGQHVLNYLIAAAAIVAGLNPALLGPNGVMIVGGAVLAGNVLHGLVTNDPTKPGGPASNVVKAIFLTVTVGVLLAITIGLSACKTAPSAQVNAGITVAVDIATGAAIQNGTSEPTVWAVRAREFKAIAVEVKGVNDAGTATLATLARDLQPLITKLPPADVLAANALVAALTPYLNQELQTNQGVANAQATVDVILQAVIDACGAYGA